MRFLFALSLLLAVTGALQAEPALRLCLVDGAKPTAARQGLQQAMGRALQATLAVEVRLAPVSAKAAAAELRSGRCDAILVLGERPRVLRRLDHPIHAADFGPAWSFEPVELVIASPEPEERRQLAAAFQRVVREIAAESAYARSE